ncbi:WUSCHEL-related homeobox 13-like, partial [Phalaenopsis equestris]
MVNPPRDEIRRIRSQLQVYGQVGDANVFYWFQNRKSRSKHKQRHLKSTPAAAAAAKSTPPPLTPASSTSTSGSNTKQIVTTLPALSTFFDQNFLQAPILMPELSLESSVLLPASYQISSGELSGGSPAAWDLIMQEVFPSKSAGASIGCVVSGDEEIAVATGTATPGTVNEIK